MTTVERILVEDRSWWLNAGEEVVTCSHQYCTTDSVVAHTRKRGKGTALYHYCERHMREYGRVLHDGKVYLGVHPDSPSAKRGYLE